jgi:hypothetical protein
VSFRRSAPFFVLAVLLSGCSRTSEPPAAAPAAAVAKISEKQALASLIAQLKAHRVKDLDCLTFFDESDTPANATADVWEFAAHEVHDDRCGGDPAVSPVRDRYQVNAAGQVLVYNAAEGEYARF